jgi:hypothetical protein
MISVSLVYCRLDSPVSFFVFYVKKPLTSAQSVAFVLCGIALGCVLLFSLSPGVSDCVCVLFSA